MTVDTHYRVQGEERPITVVWRQKIWSTVEGEYVTEPKDISGGTGLLCRVEKDGDPDTFATGTATYVTTGADGQIQCGDPVLLATLVAENDQQPGRWRVMFQVDHPAEGIIRTPSRWDRPLIAEVSPVVA